MPIKAYTGLPRAGKSYEVVSNVILPALRQGRRVISNIAGLNFEEMHNYLVGESVEPDSIGSIVIFDHSDIENSFFWRTDLDEKIGTETFIQPGDLVVIDEIWRYWDEGAKLHPRCLNFFRMHGHMSHPVTGLTCEVALISQDIGDFNRTIKRVIQETYLMVKNTKLGSDKSYVVHVFAKATTAKGKLIRTLPPRFYNPDFFAFYKSHSQQVEGNADAVESNPDDRGNILKGALFKVGLPLAVVFILASGFFLWRFLHPKSTQLITAQVVSVPITPAASTVAAAAPVALKQPEINEVWRVVGWYRSGYSIAVTLQNSAGFFRTILNPPAYKISQSGVEVQLPDGTFATPWGVQKSKGLLP